MFIKYKKTTTAAILLSTMLGSSALSDSIFKPSISGEIVTEWQNEYTYKSDDANNELNNMFGRIEVAPTIGITEHIFIDGVIVTEPFDQGIDKNPGDDRYFKSEGTFIEEAKLNFEIGDFAIWGGKFNPEFGTAWDFGRGIWGEDFAEDYEITEKLGIGTAYTIGSEKLGSHTFSASTFFNDTSLLSRSTITARQKTKLEDGGAGNTEDFSSFALSLDGDDVMGVEELEYNLSYRHLARGDVDFGTGFDDEDGYAAMINYITPAFHKTKLDLKAEYATIDNFGGIADKNHQYTTLSVRTIYDEKWNLTTSYTKRKIDEAGVANDFNDYLFQISAGYSFDNGITPEIGYRGSKESNIKSDAVGFLVRYTLEF